MSGPAPPRDALVVRVVPDETGVQKRFDYVVPDKWRELVTVGTRVRVQLGPRRVGAFVVEVGVEPPAGVTLKTIAKVSGHGPAPELIDLADWARWRWAAKSIVPFLRTASPPGVVARVPDPPPTGQAIPAVIDPYASAVVRPGVCVTARLAPADDPTPIVHAAAALGPALVVCPTRRVARMIAVRLRRAGVRVSVHPDEWAAAAAGNTTVIGTRSAAWAPCPGVRAIVVIDEHDEAHQEEGSPTWHVREVAVERARRAGAACVLLSPMPTLEAQALGELVRPDRQRERRGWPIIDVADRRKEDTARTGLFSPQLVSAVQRGQRVVCVLNQKGRAALLTCRKCKDVARCVECGGAVGKPGDLLECRRCGVTRPVLCASCGSVDVRTSRVGVTRLVEDLAALAGEPVVEVTAETRASEVDSARLYVGTEAVLHQIGRAEVVAFLDFDQELLAPRFRAAEQSLALIVRAARVVGGRADGGRVLLQTHLPDHEVIRAAVLGDPERLDARESERRQEYGFAPFGAVAEVGGSGAEAFIEALGPPPLGVIVRGPTDGAWRISAPDHTTLCNALDGVARSSGRLRLSVDPPRA